MQVDKNHIGTIVKLFKLIASDMGARFSHGNITETNKHSMLVYPYLHINIESIAVGEVLSNVSVNMDLSDRVNVITTENQGLDESVLYSEIGYTENNNYAMVLQQLYSDFVISYKKYEMQYYNAISVQKPFNLTSYIEQESDVLAGYTATFNIEIVNPIVTDGFC
jgi:hypothetical protein